MLAIPRNTSHRRARATACPTNNGPTHEKLPNAIIAASPGVALLLGTGDTLAYWNATTALGAASTTITAGNLVVPAGATNTWTLQRGGAAPQTVDPKTLRIVPGDKVTYTTTFNITAEGCSLETLVDVTPGSIAAPATGATDADRALAAYLNTGKTGAVKIGTAAVQEVKDAERRPARSTSASSASTSVRPRTAPDARGLTAQD